jgi:hypothetical protein
MEPVDPILRRETRGVGAPTTPSVVADWFRRADVRVFCSSHTGRPYAQDFLLGRLRHLVINNGAAGLPNFRESTCGVITRLSRHDEAPPDTLYPISVGPLRCDALPVDFRPRPLDRTLPRPVAAAQPRPRRLLRPHHPRDRPSPRTGSTRQREPICRSVTSEDPRTAGAHHGRPMTSASAGSVTESRTPSQVTRPGQVQIEPAAAAGATCIALGHRDAEEQQFGKLGRRRGAPLSRRRRALPIR